MARWPKWPGGLNGQVGRQQSKVSTGWVEVREDSTLQELQEQLDAE